MGELGQPLATKANAIPSQSCVCCCLWSCSQSPEWRKEMTSPSSTSLCFAEMLFHDWFFEKASFNPCSLCCTRFKHFHIPIWWWLIFIDNLWKILVTLCNTWNAKDDQPWDKNLKFNKHQTPKAVWASTWPSNSCIVWNVLELRYFGFSVLSSNATFYPGTFLDKEYIVNLHLSLQFFF